MQHFRASSSSTTAPAGGSCNGITFDTNVISSQSWERERLIIIYNRNIMRRVDGCVSLPAGQRPCNSVKQARLGFILFSWLLSGTPPRNSSPKHGKHGIPVARCVIGLFLYFYFLLIIRFILDAYNNSKSWYRKNDWYILNSNGRCTWPYYGNCIYAGLLSLDSSVRGVLFHEGTQRSK
jgi:hypothetical protein